MTVTTYRVTKKTITSKLLDDKIKINLSNCYGITNYLKEKDYNLLSNHFNKHFKPLEHDLFFIDNVNDKFNGSVVYKAPSDYLGYHDDYDLDKFEIVGTLLGEPRNYKIETDLVKVEQRRREQEIILMKKGRLHIGCIGNDHEAYKKELTERDINGVHCRGHGIYNF